MKKKYRVVLMKAISPTKDVVKVKFDTNQVRTISRLIFNHLNGLYSGKYALYINERFIPIYSLKGLIDIEKNIVNGVTVYDYEI